MTIWAVVDDAVPPNVYAVSPSYGYMEILRNILRKQNLDVRVDDLSDTLWCKGEDPYDIEVIFKAQRWQPTP